MNILFYLSAPIAAYLLGAIPFGLIIANFKRIDLRHQGSGNIGATNVFRVVGKKWGIITFALDMLKGFVAASVIAKIFGCENHQFGILIWQFICGGAAFLGHCFPIYLKFKGGKGISTGLGVLIGVAPLAAGVALLGWIIAFLLGRWVSLASIVAGLIVAISAWTFYAATPLWYKIFLTVLACAAILTHKKNVVRLLNGTENRFAFTKKQKQNGI